MNVIKFLKKTAHKVGVECSVLKIWDIEVDRCIERERRVKEAIGFKLHLNWWQKLIKLFRRGK